MSDTARLSADGKTLTVRVPLRLKQRGGRKVVMAQNGYDGPLATPKPDDALVKALARAFRWQRMLESGEHATIAEVARSEGVSPAYVSRLLKLNLLAPDIVDQIMDGRTQVTLQGDKSLNLIPMEWTAQTAGFRIADS